jgi:chromosome segregation ATPase
MNLLTISQVAIQFNVSTTYIYKLIKTKPEMEIFVVKKGKRKTYLKSEVIEYLTDSIGLNLSCLSSLKSKNKTTNKETKEKTESNLRQPIESVENKISEPKSTDSNLSQLIKTLKNQLETKDNLINDLIEKDKDERHRSDTIIMTLTQQIQSQSIQLEDLRIKKEEVPKPKKINKIFKQEIKIQEPESKPTFKQKIVYFFKPHLQRKRA